MLKFFNLGPRENKPNSKQQPTIKFTAEKELHNSINFIVLSINGK
jgi:hypothetical protein